MTDPNMKKRSTGDQANAKARETLRDQTSFVLSEDAWKEFVSALEAPPAPTPEMVELMSSKSVWER